MKIGIVSDSHGDTQALDLMLARPEAQEVEGWFFAGDIAMDAEYLAMVTQLPVAKVAGNNDWPYTSLEDALVTEIEGSRKSDAGSLVELFHRAGRPDAVAVADFRDAFREARRRQGRDRLFICGSLYLAGETEEIIHDQL